MPFEQLITWLNEEKQQGAPNSYHAILSILSTTNFRPHARVVAIREITKNELLFFTQKDTRKVAEINSNSHVTLTFWLALYQRQVIIEGVAEALSNSENESYWCSYPREAQIRFSAYAPTSGQPISSKQVLEDKRKKIDVQYQDKDIPMSTHYCGFRIKPYRFIFYAYQTPALSDVLEYRYEGAVWRQQLLSP